jgi:hypothetical protein
MFGSLSAAAAPADAISQYLQQLQECLQESERLRSHGSALAGAAVAGALSSCRSRARPLALLTPTNNLPPFPSLYSQNLCRISRGPG